MSDTTYEQVLAIENGGEYHLVAETEDELHDRLDEDGEIEIDAGQCDSCGSFNDADGETGRGYIVRRRDPDEPLRGTAAFCGCCERERQIVWHESDDTVW